MRKMDARSNTQIEPQYGDLRDLIGHIDKMGELVRIDGADWDLELGGLLDMIYHEDPQNPPALLFDNIKGYLFGDAPKVAEIDTTKEGSVKW